MLIKFNKPQNLNGGTLISELRAVGIQINTRTSPRLDGDGSFWLDIDPDKENEAKAIVEAHQG